MESGHCRRWSWTCCLTSDYGFWQGTYKADPRCEELRGKLLNRRWTLVKPDAQIHRVVLSSKQAQNVDGLVLQRSWSNDINPSFADEALETDSLAPSFYVVRDDLIHPLMNGNKARKLDALLPFLEDHSVTDVVRFHRHSRDSPLLCSYFIMGWRR